MKNIVLFIKLQKLFLSLLILLIILPFSALCLYLPQVPYTQYFFFIVLLCLKAIIFNEVVLEKRFTPIVQSNLSRENGKPASSKVIFDQVQFHIKARDYSMLGTGLILLLMALLFQKF
jgi:hypothetical protein